MKKQESKKPNPNWVDAPYECIVGFDLEMAEKLREATEELLGKKMKCEYLKNGLYRVYEV